MFGIRTPPSGKARGTTRTPPSAGARYPHHSSAATSRTPLASQTGHERINDTPKSMCSITDTPKTIPDSIDLLEQTKNILPVWRKSQKQSVKEIEAAINASRNLKKEYKEKIEAALGTYGVIFACMMETLEELLVWGKQKQDSSEQTRLLLETRDIVKNIQEKIDKQQETGEVRKTYAEATLSGPTPKQPAVLHSLVVSSKDGEMTGEEVLTRLRETVNAKEGWTKVERVRKAKDRKVVMAFATTAERARVRERLETKGKGLLVEEVQNRDPLLVLRGVISDNTDEDILKALKNQNRHLFDGLDQETCRVKVRYRRKARNPHTAHVVLETSPPLWTRITSAGYVHIDLQRVKAEDQSPLVQCSRCLAYGHSRKFCTESADACSHCGGPHLKAQCTDFAAQIPPSCRNCRRAKLDEVGHNAFSDSCPVRRRWDELARSSVAYC